MCKYTRDVYLACLADAATAADGVCRCGCRGLGVGGMGVTERMYVVEAVVVTLVACV